MVSVVMTTLNEVDTIKRTMNSLKEQEMPYEIIVVDGGSKDGTVNILHQLENKNDNISIYVKEGCSIGEGLNHGILNAKGEIIALIGADDVAHPEWVHDIRHAFEDTIYVLSGRIIDTGEERFMHSNVAIHIQGYDVAIPSTNTAYRRSVFDTVGYFDDTFRTAEDIDMHIRIVKAGYRLEKKGRPILYRFTRQNMLQFIKQSYRNGYGRKQLSLKHGRMWKKYKKSAFKSMRKHMNVTGIIRLSFGLLGYIECKIMNVIKHGKQNN